MENLAIMVRHVLPANPWLKYAFVVMVIILAFILLRYIAHALQLLVHKILEKKGSVGKDWLAQMNRNKLFRNIFFAIGSAFIASWGGAFLKELFPQTPGLIAVKVLNSVVIVAVMLCFNSALSVVSDRYYKEVRFPVQGLVQAIKVILWIITIILVLSVLIEKDPWYFIGGLTALSAVIMLVFKDSIVGLASGFQLSLNDSVRVGDWIEVPGQQANGPVSDILLTTIRVRNWDNTVVNIPAYTLISSAFRNWRGVNEAGSRRLDCTFYIDMSTVKILTDEETAGLKNFPLMKDIVQEQEERLKDAGGLTNLALFRLYCEAFLTQHPDRVPGSTVIVHHLNPGAQGQPLQLLAYSTFTGGVPFEHFQSEIIEHVLSTAPKFGLRMYQTLGNDNTLNTAQHSGQQSA